MSKKVFIGVGHGGVDSGAVNGKLKEKDIVLQIALVVNEVLINHNISTKMSRERDENDTIQDEVKEEKSFRSDLAIDIHINAGGGNGFEVFHHHLGGRSKTLAQNIEREVLAIGQNSRGCKTKLNSSGTADYYMFIRETVGSAVIVECAFIDTEDIK
ncbi:MAG: N-acetylmuramoyl-L-alanine amidase family protein, partial [Sarcina sp.]